MSLEREWLGLRRGVLKAVWLLIGHFLCWGISIGYSGVVFFLVGSLWQQEHRQHPWAASEERLLTPQAVQAFLDHFSWTGPQPARVTTGVYLQGLSFKSPSEVGLTGIIWQHYLNGEHDHIQSRGFILPEEVEVGNLVAPQEIFRRQKGDSLRIGWRFDATVRQWFHYGNRSASENLTLANTPFDSVPSRHGNTSGLTP